MTGLMLSQAILTNSNLGESLSDRGDMVLLEGPCVENML